MTGVLKECSSRGEFVCTVDPRELIRDLHTDSRSKRRRGYSIYSESQIDC